MDYGVYKNFLQTQGYSVVNRVEKIECTGEWLLSMITQGFIENPKSYEKNIMTRFDSNEIWGR